ADAGAGFVDVGPLLEFTVSATFIDFDVALPVPSVGTSLAVRILASDDAGDGTGTFIRVNLEGEPASSGTFRLDNVVFTGSVDLDDAGVVVSDAGVVVSDAGVVPPDAGQGSDGGVVVDPDAGAVQDAGAPPSSPLRITEIFFNAASTVSDVGKEWIEIENTSATPVSLDGWKLMTIKGILTPEIETEIVFSETSTTLEPGELLLIVQSANMAVDVCLNSPIVVVDVSSFALGQSGNQFVKLIAPVDFGADLFHEVRYVGGGLSASTFDGVSLDVASNAPSTCTAIDGFTGSPGTTDAQCNVSGVDLCPVTADGGVLPIDDAGQVEPEPDPAANNTAPEISLSAPTGENNTTNITISYVATDSDDDVVEVALFYDTDGQGFDGVLVAEGLPGGAKDYLWDTTGTLAGRYRVFGRVTDVFGVQTYAYADGNVQVGEPIAESASIVFVEPDGVNDTQEDGSILISFIAEMPADSTGTVSLFYDSNQEGGDGTPLAAAIQVESGVEAFFVWDTSEVPAGSYAIAAVFTWTGGSVATHSEFVQISGGCSCTSPTKKNQWGQILLSLGALAMLAFPRRRRKRVVEPEMR
ncbi:MAG: lamin tail domain-containing protein, partial [Deltaproteobacteria bacterium]|nr:lamin tail domain-containing protein [Deltaproteobacteria bacterium]